MDDVTEIIKNLSAKTSRLEMENKNKNKLVQDNDNKSLINLECHSILVFSLEIEETLKNRKYFLLSK